VQIQISLGSVRGQAKTNICLSKTFTPILQITSLRILLTLATMEECENICLGHGVSLPTWQDYHDIYLNFPDGYEKLGKVGKLNKAIYGLPEATQVWHEDLEEMLKSCGFLHLSEATPVYL